jgi:hypothetical protein
VRRLLTAGAALLAVLAGCASPIPGTPVPVADDPAAVVDLPPRPRIVPLDGIDPCTLLTTADRIELGLDGEPQLTASPSNLYNGGTIQLCSIRGSEPATTVGVALSITGGLEVFLQPGLQATVTTAVVSGYPALIVDPARFDEWCNVVVDVSPGQVVDVDVANGGRTPPLTQAELCRDAERVANIVMNNLLR